MLQNASWSARRAIWATNVSSINSNTQAIRDKEIREAYRCGVDCRVFLLYGTEPDILVEGQGNDTPILGLNNGYRRYLTSSYKSQQKHCFIIDGTRWGWSTNGTNAPVADFDAFTTAIVTKLQDADYLKVDTTRPVLFCLTLSGLVSQHGSNAAALTALNAFRTKCTNAGMGTPYLISMDGSTTAATATALGMNALSNYAIASSGLSNVEHPYSTLTAACATEWNANKAAYANAIPLAMSGLDARARLGSVYDDGSSYPWRWWFAQPTTAQLTAHLQAAIDWSRTNSSFNPFDLVVVYAKYESTEGGFIAPTFYDLGTRYQAIAQQLARQRENRGVLRARGLQLKSR
jgi:hypothetical protein